MAELKSTTISGPLSGTSATFSGDLTIDTNTLYVDSTNNKVGIRNASPLNLFDVKGAIFTGSYATSAGARFHDNVYGINFGGIDASSVGVIQGSAFEVGAANIALQPNGGNVGIGTAGPTALLNTYSATTATQIIVTGADTTNQRLEVTDGTVTNRFGIFGRTNGDAGVLGTQTNHALLLQTNATTRLTIASTGAATFSNFNGAALYGVTINSNNNTGTQYMMSFDRIGVQAGYIASTSSTTAGIFNSSDYRLKEDLQSFSGIGKLMSMKFYDFKWKSEEGFRDYGVIAHELQEVLPMAVIGEKDGEVNQGVDYSKLIPIMAKAIQELKAEIDLLKGIAPIST